MDSSKRNTRNGGVSVARRPIAIAAVFGAVLLLVAIGARSSADAPNQDRPAHAPMAEAAPTPATQNAIVPSRSRALADYPCTDCHKGDGQKGESGVGAGSHNHIELAHLPNSQDCFACHDPIERNKFILVTGKHVEFDHVQDLCGQCHMSKKRDWDRGIHGKQVGSWSGLKHRYACTDCHDAHKPGFAPVKALPAPVFPKYGIPKHPTKKP